MPYANADPMKRSLARDLFQASFSSLFLTEAIVLRLNLLHSIKLQFCIYQ